MTAADHAAAWLGAFVAELARLGVGDACICPGSRSTPLALAFSRHGAIRPWMHLDERSAGFFGLGLARGRGAPVALICTSGTAAANFAPAVIEAFYSGVPLLVLTADRPPELRGWGAPQTIDQVGLYGRQVKWFAEPGLPEATPAGLRQARALAARAALVAVEGFPGPVHVNLPFREPLVPAAPAGAAARATPPAAPVPLRRPPCPPDPASLQALADAVARADRGLIVCGPQEDPAFAAALRSLAAATAFPVLADPLSQVRCGPAHGPQVMETYDACLREPAFAAAAAPDLVLRFGGVPTSKPLNQFLRGQEGCARYTVDPAWRDPDHRAEVVAADAGLTAAALAERLGAGRQAGPWLRLWQGADATARAVVADWAASRAGVSEAGLFPELAGLLPAGASVLAGNSMPVRDLDSFLPGGPRPLRIFGNRGANGIDGVISTALGHAAATGAPTVLVIGDISFYHDMNGLLAARRYGPPLLIVVVGNDGGGIFSFLPQAELGTEFEPLFGTPHGLEIGDAARMYGLPHARVQTWPSFRAAVTEGLAAGGTRIVEVPSERGRNAAEHREIWAAVGRALRAGGLGDGPR